MPACEPWCPIVRIELKKIVAQAPWIQNEQLEFASVEARGAAPSLERDGEQLLTESADVKWGDREQRAAADDLFDSQHHPASYADQGTESWLDVMDAVDVKSAKESREFLSHDQTVFERKVRSATHSTQSVGTFTSKADDSLASATAVGSRAGDSLASATTVAFRADDSLASATAVGSRAGDSLASSVSAAVVSTKGTVTTGLTSDKLVETDSAVGSSGQPGGMDRETIAEGRGGSAAFPDDCEPTCPRRISRENRIRKLEERQSTVDAYLLNKGTNYFDDVCTCSLSCVVRSLKDDSFIRSTLASAVLFTLGLKLCMELDAWYLPIRLS
ncbi:uncharacterized protein LOC143375220 [Andrena cerasifolii]|uniref:uncharacterized protein LOC143375220 n=1 Tax=Andrena cerasifolii TaxID=2819439 RepID=UPI0040382A25